MAGPDAAPATDEAHVRLARELDFKDATLLGMGALMGGGVFVLLGFAAGISGNGLLVALFLNGLVTFPTLLVYMELSSTSEGAGGGYLWVRQAFGNTLGFLGGWFGWFSHIIACALYSIACAAFILALGQYAGWIGAIPHWQFGPLLELGAFTLQPHVGLTQILAVLVAGMFLALNYSGLKVGIRAENIINSVVFVAVAGFIVAGLWAVGHRAELVTENFTPFWRDLGAAGNLSGIILAMGITFIAFEGYEIISQTAEEIREPRRSVPRAILTSFLVTWGIILLIAFIALGATQSPDGAQAWSYLGDLRERGLITMADQIMPYGTIVITGAAILLQVTALNATIYSSSRVSFAMGRDGNLPRLFGKVHPTRRTPYFAVLGSGALIVAMSLLPLKTVLVSAALLFLILFIFVNLAYIKLRKTIPQERFGFKAPLFPYLPLVAIFTQFFLAIHLWRYEPVAWYLVVAWFLLGLLVYATYIRRVQPAPEASPPAISPLPRPVVRGPRKDYRVLVLLSSPAPSTARSLARAAGTIAKALDGEVVLLQGVLVPELTPLAEGQRFAKDQSLLNEARRAVPPAVPVHATVRIGHNLDAMVRETVREEGTQLLIMSGQARATVGQPTSPLLAYPPCDIAVLRLKTPEVTAHDVLFSTQTGTNANLGIRLGTALAKAFGGTLTLFHVRGPHETAEQATLWGRTQLEHHAVAGVKTAWEAGEGNVVRAVLDKSRGHDLVVVGANVASRPWRKNLFGPRTQEVADRVAGNVLLVLSAGAHPEENWWGRWLLRLRRYFLPE
jgi:amino acid transporter